MPMKNKKPITRKQFDRFMAGESGYEAMGGRKSPNAGRQGIFSRAAEDLMRKNPEMFDDMIDDEKTQKFAMGGDVRFNSNRGKTY